MTAEAVKHDETKTKEVERLSLDAKVGDGGVSNVARIKLKRFINDALVDRNISISSFAQANGVARQYMYRILSEDANAASTDRLLDYASQLGFKMSLLIEE